MPINSKQKGKRGERLWRDVLREWGLTAKRGQQFAGSPDSPDVICDELGDIHFEVKFTEKVNLYGAIDQAIKDAGGKMHIIAHKRNNWPWYVTLRADEFMPMLLKHKGIR
jgi:Holliday junction resolvase